LSDVAGMITLATKIFGNGKLEPAAAPAIVPRVTDLPS
jgi:hypothetical protein